MPDRTQWTVSWLISVSGRPEEGRHGGRIHARTLSQCPVSYGSSGRRMIPAPCRAPVRHRKRMSGVADIASIVTSGATCVALVFAGLELRQSRARDRRRRQVEIEGVAVSWRPPEVPRGPQDVQGRGCWVYECTAHNPGQLPVSDVRVEILFALDVERIHYDGHIDEPTRTLTLETPVLAGGRERTWRRRLLMNYTESHAALRKTTAVISFIDPGNTHSRHQNTWPKHEPQTDDQGK